MYFLLNALILAIGKGSGIGILAWRGRGGARIPFLLGLWAAHSDFWGAGICRKRLQMLLPINRASLCPFACPYHFSAGQCPANLPPRLLDRGAWRFFSLWAPQLAFGFAGSSMRLLLAWLLGHILYKAGVLPHLRRQCNFSKSNVWLSIYYGI